MLEQFDTPARMLDEPKSPFVKKFLTLPDMPELARRVMAPAEAAYE